ncbi:MAG: flagellar basal body rod protein FlgB [Geminicoccales bacterium]
MLPTQATLFQLISARMTWLGQRQVVLSQNLANADTPDYRPRDLKEADFARLAGQLGGRAGRVRLATTDPLHVEGAAVARLALEGRPVDSGYEVAPAGNAVILEEQMAKATQTALDYQLTSNLYRKYLGMVRIALGTER